MLISITPIMSKIEKVLDYYPFIVAKGFIFELTRINWQYGFFTSDSERYQYITYDVALVDEATGQTVNITENGNFTNIGTKINAIRFNTAIQQIVRDSIYLEAGSRSIALYLFNKNLYFQNIDFSIQGHEVKIDKQNNRFVLSTSIDTLFNRRLSY